MHYMRADKTQVRCPFVREKCCVQMPFTQPVQWLSVAYHVRAVKSVSVSTRALHVWAGDQTNPGRRFTEWIC